MTDKPERGSVQRRISARGVAFLSEGGLFPKVGAVQANVDVGYRHHQEHTPEEPKETAAGDSRTNLEPQSRVRVAPNRGLGGEGLNWARRHTAAALSRILYGLCISASRQAGFDYGTSCNMVSC